LSSIERATLVELFTMAISSWGRLLVRNAAADGASELEMEIRAVSVLGNSD